VRRSEFWRRARRRDLKHSSRKQRRTVKSVVKTIALALAMLGLTAIASAFILYWWYTHDLRSPNEALADSGIGASTAYDRSGEQQLYEYTDPLQGVRHPVPLERISPYLVAATVATEDPSFFGNPGVNFRGIFRATFENLTPFGPGFFAGSGGSSITQQLARNVYVDPAERSERSIERKLKETAIALELKRRYGDEEILEWYLNQVYYGYSAYGVEAAAQRYFGKGAQVLTLAEAALIAGLPQAPSEYSPAVPENRELAKARQLQVLDLMVAHAGDIDDLVQVSAEEIEAARSEPLNYVAERFDIQAPHFVFFVEDQVKKMCDEGLFAAPKEVSCESVVGRGGLRITTTLDMGLQDIGERAVDEELSALEARSGGHNGSLVAIQPGSGEILTYVGSRDYFREDISGQVDIATSLQSHGSSMKVFTYLTAFEQGWVPSTWVQDEPLTLVAGDPATQINNWNSKYLGRITVRKALSESVNTTAVRTVIDAGVGNVRDTAHRMGITDLREDGCGPAITLGACEVKLVDMAYAFSALANNGALRGRTGSEDLPDGYRELDPVSVLKIEDIDGNVIYEYAQPEERKVAEAAHAFMITDILSKQGIKWSGLEIGRPAAAKTGTSDEFTDGVVLGYTRDLSVGVWVGNADNTPMAPDTFSAASAGPVWKRFMTEAHAYLQAARRPFERPDSVYAKECRDVEEVFEKGETPSKPGACAAGEEPSPSPTGETATPEATVSPAPEETPTPTPSSAPGSSGDASPTPDGSATPEPSPVPIPTPPVLP